MKVNFQSSESAISSFIIAHVPPPAEESTTVKKPHVFLSPEKINGSITYSAKSQLDQEVSKYAFDRLHEIGESLRYETDGTSRATLLRMGEFVKKDFESISNDRGVVSRLWNTLMVTLGFRHSTTEIADEFALLERQKTVPQFGGCISEDRVSQRIENHRNVTTNRPELDKSYNEDSLTDEANALYDVMVKNAQLPTGEPQRQIKKAKIKEKAVLFVYNSQMDDQVKKGYYDPGIIPHEIDKILGPITGIPAKIEGEGHLEQLLLKEVDKYKRHLSRHQIHYIKEDIAETIKLYHKAYPNKSLVDAFALGRDMIRATVYVYQEIYDKASFTRSDHGSKHIHHNIDNADGLESGMAKGNDKDKFMARFIHFYHDIGYTTGLSSQNFDCCKDHPFIGAKMIDENRKYFAYYLSDGESPQQVKEAQDAVDVFRNGVLFHLRR